MGEDSARTEQLLDEAVRLIALALKRDMENQTQAILAFSDVGLEPTRVAELLGTTPATVRATVHRASKTKKPARKGVA